MAAVFPTSFEEPISAGALRKHLSKISAMTGEAWTCRDRLREIADDAFGESMDAGGAKPDPADSPGLVGDVDDALDTLNRTLHEISAQIARLQALV